MRESNYTFPPQNRAVTNITHMIYDRRALDTNSPLALLNSLTSLTYLTSTSPRIRDILTVDGGLERLLDILRGSCLPKESPVVPDLWGLNGPPTARVITVERANSLRHSLAFQCVVNIGVRGSEEIRTRVVQAGALDLVAQILESWLRDHGFSIFAGHLGSEAAVQAYRSGRPIPGVDQLRRRERKDRDENGDRERAERGERERSERAVHRRHSRSMAQPVQDDATPSTSNTDAGRPMFANFSYDPNTGAWAHSNERPTPTPQPQESQGDTDVDMADGEGGGETDDASIADDISIDVDVSGDQSSEGGPSMHPSTTPRATTSFLPMAIAAPARHQLRETQSQASSVGDSYSGGEDSSAEIPRNTSESDITGAQGLRPPPLNLARVPHLAQDPVSTQSSPMGTPTRMDGAESGGMQMRATRRGTIVGRPVNLAPRNDRRREHTAGSGTSDGGEDIDLPTATINAGIAAANAQAMEGGGTIVPDEVGPPPNVEIVETTAGQGLDEPDPEAIAAEQARLDMEAGAPPGQPGAAIAQTPRVNNAEAATPRQAPGQEITAPVPDPTQIIIANGAPRGFQDLGSYVGISSLLNPDGNRYSDDSILLALQLLAYLSKYPHVRTAFHHPRRPMHHTFDLGLDFVANPLPERPPYSETPDIFSLVERFTFRPSPSDPLVFKIPAEIQYWAGVIMRNACRKDEGKGGIRQCANMSCGRWEKFPREFAKCRRCRKAKYCSKECQSRAWQEGHRFWCSTRNDPEPGSAAAAAEAAGSAQAGVNREATPAPEDDDDFQIGLQMGLSPDVVSRALAAARAAGVIPVPRPPTAPHTTPVATLPAVVARPTAAPAPSEDPTARHAMHPTGVPFFGPGRDPGPTHAHAHLIEGDLARQLALDSQSQRWRSPHVNANIESEENTRGRMNTREDQLRVAPASAHTHGASNLPRAWRTNAFQASPSGSADLGTDRQSSGAARSADPSRLGGGGGGRQNTAPAYGSGSVIQGERRASRSATGTATEERRESPTATGVRGLGFQLTEERR